jgi:hypothetical protein
VRRLVELGRDLVARAAGPGAFRAAALDHEALDDAVKADAVVEAALSERHHVADVPRGVLGIESETDRAGGGVERDLVVEAVDIDGRRGLLQIGGAGLGHRCSWDLGKRPILGLRWMRIQRAVRAATISRGEAWEDTGSCAAWVVARWPTSTSPSSSRSGGRWR